MIPEAFIFDLDGVVANTAEYHFRAWRRLADELGLKFDEQTYQRIKGVERQRTFELILAANGKTGVYTKEQHAALADEKNNYYVEMIVEISPSDIQRGILHLLERARDSGLKLGLATISNNAPIVVNNLEIGDCFDYINYNDDPQKKRLDKDVFLSCANKLGVAPENCVAFANSEVGINAIKAAKMHAVGIDLPKARDMTAAADYVVGCTRELNFLALMEFFAALK